MWEKGDGCKEPDADAARCKLWLEFPVESTQSGPAQPATGCQVKRNFLWRTTKIAMLNVCGAMLSEVLALCNRRGRGLMLDRVYIQILACTGQGMDIHGIAFDLSFPCSPFNVVAACGRPARQAHALCREFGAKPGAQALVIDLERLQDPAPIMKICGRMMCGSAHVLRAALARHAIACYLQGASCDAGV